MPFRYHDAYRHTFEKARYRVTNWQDCERGPVQRGDILFRIEESALGAWPAPLRKIPGEQAVIFKLAIETTLMLALSLRSRSGRRARRTAAVSEKVMRRRLPALAVSPGGSAMITAYAHWAWA
ncbi:hypothetical protein [Pelagibius sp. Alg239-R121]|uniref:hypothetical protein n=1 Tax=Pelagibius sp. Alg239-R121 TaxID=2993448 RepID=UPI0024A73AAC|nr:hypothetical protein [Pelagibius sp. Alg239-R121]